MSVSMKGREISETQRLRQSQAMKGRRLTAEHKTKVSLRMKGRVISEETKRRISASKRGANSARIGEANGRAKLTKHQALFIRNSTLPASVFVRSLGITDTTVYGIRNGRLWK